jgi:N-acetylglucosamine kinase-like BadF-type ATPase
MAGLPATPFDSAFLGLAGVVSPKDQQIVLDIAGNLKLTPPHQTGVGHDIRIALAGGLSGRPGIAQIAGTGSSCYGVNAAGEDWKAGGWGGLLSDEGSSYWLGVQAMKKAVQSFDGRVGPTLLMERIRQALGLNDMNEIVYRVYVAGISRPEIAALAPLVTEAGRAGDEVAMELLRQGAEDMAECVLAVARRLNMATGPCELVLIGGLFQAGEIVVEPMKQAVSARLSECTVSWPELPPVLGAGLLALQQLDVPIEEPVIQALQQSKKLLADQEGR